MNGQTKFPRGQGRPISVRRARSEQNRWKNNPRNGGFQDTFPVDVSLVVKALKMNPEATGIEFCNGMSGNEYTPVMAAVTGEGVPLAAFNSTEDIGLEEFKSCRAQWIERYGNDPDVLQFFFIGEEALIMNIEDFDVTRYEACFVEKANDQNSGILYGYSGGVAKDPGDDDPDTALNFAQSCPPICEDE